MSMCCPTPVSMRCPTCVSMCCPTCVPWSIYHLATSARPPSPSNRSQSCVRRTQGRGNLLARAHVVTSFTKRWQGHLSPGPERSSSRRVGKSHTASCGLQPPSCVSLVPAPRPYCTPSQYCQLMEEEEDCGGRRRSGGPDRPSAQVAHRLSYTLSRRQSVPCVQLDDKATWCQYWVFTCPQNAICFP